MLPELPGLPDFTGDSVNLDLASNAAESANLAQGDGGRSFIDREDWDVLEGFEGILAASRQFEEERKKIELDEKKKKIIAAANGMGQQWVT